MSVAEDPPTLSEIARVLVDFRNEMRGQLLAFQRADVYAADRREMELRVKNVEDRAARVEADLEKSEIDKSTLRRQMVLVVVAGVIAFAFNLALLLLR